MRSGNNHDGRKMLSVFATDETKAKLFFAQDLLWELNNIGQQTYLITSEKYEKGYADFLNHFQNLKVQRSYDPKNIFRVKIIDKIEQIDEQTLSFPVLDQKDSGEYNTLRSDNAMKMLLPPLIKTSDSHAYINGDVSWFMDMLRKNIGKNNFKNIKFLVSAGPTREFFDPVRFLGNRSTGKMGIAIARAAFMQGAQVMLVLGPTVERAPDYLNIIRVQSAAEMSKEVINNFDQCDVYIGAAAVADYTVEKISRNKIKKSDGTFQPKFKRTTDILSEVGKRRKKQILIGFSVETEKVYQNSLKKLKNKNLDMIIINNPNEKGAAFAVDTNRVAIVYKNAEREDLPLQSKLELSNEILKRILNLKAEL